MQPPPASAKRVLMHAVAATLAYVVALKFIFPLHFSRAAHHGDMYMRMYPGAPGAETSGAFSLQTVLSCPRPLFWWITLRVAELPFEASLMLYAAVWIANLTLLLALLERYFLQEKVSAIASFTTCIVAFSGPSFYFSHTYDSATVFATLFGILAVWAIEARPRSASNIVCGGILCLMSGLTKESFLPALLIYGVAWFIRERAVNRSTLWQAATPAIATILVLLHAVAVRSEFVQVAGSTVLHPYRIDFSLAAITKAAQFYIAPLVNLSTVLLFTACLIAAWLRGRLLLGAGIFVAAFSLYLPYFVLPNHLLGYYAWTPFPLLVLLVPIALTGELMLQRGARIAVSPRVLSRALSFGLVILCAAAVLEFRQGNIAGSKWALEQEQVSRNLLESLRALRSELIRARSIVVLGLRATFHPWQHPDFLRREMGFVGVSYIVTRENPAEPQAGRSLVVPLTVDRVNWSDHDLIIVLEESGTLRARYSKEEIESVASRYPFGSEDVAAAASDPALFALLQRFAPRSAEAGTQATAIGRAFQQAGRFDAALHFLRQALANDDRNAYAHFYAGLALEALRDIPAARRHFARAVELDAQTPSPNVWFIEALKRCDAAAEP